MPGRVRFLWFEWRDVKRMAALIFTSALLHVLIAVLLIILGLLNTNIMEMQVEWSDRPLTGLGTWADPATTVAPADPEKLGKEDGKEEPESPNQQPQDQADPKEVKTARAEQPEPEPDKEKPEPTPEPEQANIPETIEVDTPETDPSEDAEPKKTEPEPEKEEPEPQDEEPRKEEPKPEKEEPEPAEIPDVDAAMAENARRKKLADAMAPAIPKGSAAKGTREKAGHVAENLPAMQEFGPGNARLIVLVRNDRLRGTNYEDSTRALFKKFPDFQIALGESDIDPMESLSAMLIATTNPAIYHETFLAVRHTVPEDDFKDALKKSFPGEIDWTNHMGKPLGKPKAANKDYARSLNKRWIYMPEPGLALWLQPRLLKSIHEAPPLSPIEDGNTGDDKDEELAQRSIMEALQDIETIDGAEGTEPAVFVMVRGIKGLKFGAGLPQLPAMVALTGSLTASGENPRLVMKLEFESEADAVEFMEVWPEFVKAAGDLDVMGLSSALDALELERKDNLVYSDGELPSWVVSMLLVAGTSSLPDVRPPDSPK